MADDLCTTVIKVGGSLFDLPDLRSRLGGWLDSLPSRRVLLMPGGGRTADLVRDLDTVHRLGEEAAHWLALRALSLNAAVLQALLPHLPIIKDWREAAQGNDPMAAIIDPFSFARAGEARPEHLPHCWEVTSDSIAARFAVVCGARLLILLKSVHIPDGMDWTLAARHGYVDALFAETCAAEPKLVVHTLNFRNWVESRRER